MVNVTYSNAEFHSFAGAELPRFIRLQELARHSVHDRDIELVRHIQYLLRPEASSRGNYSSWQLTLEVLR